MARSWWQSIESKWQVVINDYLPSGDRPGQVRSIQGLPRWSTGLGWPPRCCLSTAGCDERSLILTLGHRGALPSLQGRSPCSQSWPPRHRVAWVLWVKFMTVALLYRVYLSNVLSLGKCWQRKAFLKFCWRFAIKKETLPGALKRQILEKKKCFVQAHNLIFRQLQH